MDLYSKHTNPETLYGYKDRFKIPSFAWEEAFATGEWTEAEPYIMKDPSSAFPYARWVIGDRWTEAEPYIMKNPFSAYNYKEFIRAL